MKLQLEGTSVFQNNWQANQEKWRIIANEGGTGSSKTYSLAQVFLLFLIQAKKGCVLTVARKTMPALRATAMRDFFNILKQANLYNPNNHDKTNNTYTYRGNFIEFISVDDPARVRSRRRNYLWLNEANEFELEDWRQLSMRTVDTIFLDYNPSHQYHWLYDEVLPRKDCLIIKSTYKDNPFLSNKIIKEIEHYEEIDENYWRVYGLGLRGIKETTIYKNWAYCDELPEGDGIYGIDFGYNYPTAISEIKLRDEGWYAKERLYSKYLTNSQLIEKLKELNIPKQKEIYCDSAEPQRIAEIQNAGYWAIPADKDVRKGIDTINSRKLFITKDSLNLANEIKKYSWKQRGEEIDENPIKINDHLLDSMRYAIHSHYKEFGIKEIIQKEKELTIDEIRKEEILEAIRRANNPLINNSLQEDYRGF